MVDLSIAMLNYQRVNYRAIIRPKHLYAMHHMMLMLDAAGQVRRT